MNAAIAVELIHNYSLIHDDLPAMDNDDLEEVEQLTIKNLMKLLQFLQMRCLYAFEILSNPATHPDPEIRCQLIKTLSLASGTGHDWRPNDGFRKYQ